MQHSGKMSQLSAFEVYNATKSLSSVGKTKPAKQQNKSHTRPQFVVPSSKKNPKKVRNLQRNFDFNEHKW